MARDFSIQEEQLGDTGLVAVQGELDVATANQLDAALLVAEAASRGPLLLDLCELDFIDSTGLRSILSSIKRLTEASRSLTVACPPGPVRRLFEITALTGQFDLHDSRQAALDASRR